MVAVGVVLLCLIRNLTCRHSNADLHLRNALTIHKGLCHSELDSESFPINNLANVIIDKY